LDKEELMTNNIKSSGMFSEEEMEEYLQRRLQPVKPSPEFINRVNKRIIRDQSVMLEPTTDQSIVYIILFGLLTGFIALWIMRLFRK
jgi:hypothetical protein